MYDMPIKSSSKVMLRNAKEDLEKNVIFVYMNVNGECETAQKKAKWVKATPGIIVRKEFISQLYVINNLQNRDDLMIFDSFEYEGNESYIIFSLDQCTNLDLSSVNSESLFLLNRKYYLQVRQKIASNYNKQGSDLYK